MLATLAAIVAALVLAATSQAAETNRIENGGFEAGLDGWSAVSASACVSPGCVPAPAAGSRFAYLGSFGGTQAPGLSVVAVGSLSQSVDVAEAPARLELSLRRIDFGPSSIDTSLTASLGGTELIHEDSTAAGQFVHLSVPIPAELVGGPATLTLESTCTNTDGATITCDRYDLDQVALITGKPDASSDTTPPQTTITKLKAKAKVKSKRKKATVTARFASSEDGSSFACAIDKGAYKPCESPKKLKLRKGKHKLRVRATDAAGNTDPSPATGKVKVKVEKRRR